jgi:predicted enzyme related to lactoylglutathione lyase
MGRPIHFEISAEDPDRIIGFYEAIFGWQAMQWGNGSSEYWLLRTGEDEAPGINGGLMRRGSGMAAQTVNTIDVDSVDEAAARIEAFGGAVIMPKRALPGVGWLAYCQDPEGTTFGIMEQDPEAA